MPADKNYYKKVKRRGGNIANCEHKRASVSVITRLGHKDNVIAQEIAYLLSNSIKKPVCVIAGIHLDNITKVEIDKILRNTRIAIEELINLREMS